VNWARVRRAESPIAYARRALTNTFIDEGRRPYRRSEQQVAEPEAGSEPARRAADPATTQTLLAALAELPPRQRAVVVLRHWLDLDIARTADLLNCSEGTVKSQNAKAVQHLRAALPHTLIGELS
jgi:RNA polymerase sigma factor (sigma-70 family)